MMKKLRKERSKSEEDRRGKGDREEKDLERRREEVNRSRVFVFLYGVLLNRKTDRLSSAKPNRIDNRNPIIILLIGSLPITEVKPKTEKIGLFGSVYSVQTERPRLLNPYKYFFLFVFSPSSFSSSGLSSYSTL